MMCKRIRLFVCMTLLLCKRIRLFVYMTLLSCACFAQDRAAGIVYNSTVVTNNAWKRDVVMRHEPTGEIYNDQGKVGSAAAVAAANTAADGAASMAEAAHDSMTNEMRRLEVGYWMMSFMEWLYKEDL